VRRAAALIIGNELLSGKVDDANLVVLARTLRAIGVRLDRVVMVPDERALIADEVKQLSSTREVLFTSGGVGPTHDDVTVEAVADAFGVETVMSSEIETMLRGYYGDSLTDGHLLMARIPKGARLSTTPEMPWPTIVMHNVWVLPGVPQIFAMKMPVVIAELGGARPFVSRALYTTLDEGPLKPLLDQVVASHPTVEIGSYPKWREPRYRTKITFDGLEEALVVAAREALAALLPALSIVDIEEP
jgi:molybdenum cofactor synthesis domain-containing protein